MANPAARVPENVPGDLYVDETCIDCETCRFVAPATFACSTRDLSYVHAQPRSEQERERAAMALVACPTSSIGTLSRLDVRKASRAFPELVAGDDVYYCGYAAESSFGASSWLIRRAAGNVLVDSPRAARPLLERIDQLGGVRYMFLTHRDDVADHEKFRNRFGCERILHHDDLTPDTAGVERIIRGQAVVKLDSDLLLIPVPGHTRGSMALLYRGEVLFSGDHLWWSPERAALHASRSVNWYSWSEQTRSMERLLQHGFQWVLPGHGHRHRALSRDAMQTELRALVERMKAT
jgi:glyoxylase-like metal-dependent hydrolase (beta-lactamase superfamily II)/ferredoxin